MLPGGAGACLAECIPTQQKVQRLMQDIRRQFVVEVLDKFRHMIIIVIKSTNSVISIITINGITSKTFINPPRKKKLWKVGTLVFPIFPALFPHPHPTTPLSLSSIIPSYYSIIPSFGSSSAQRRLWKVGAWVLPIFPIINSDPH